MMVEEFKLFGDIGVKIEVLDNAFFSVKYRNVMLSGFLTLTPEIRESTIQSLRELLKCLSQKQLGEEQ